MQFTVIIRGRILETIDCYNSKMAWKCASNKFGDDITVESWDKTPIEMRKEYMYRKFGDTDLAESSDEDLAFEVKDVDTTPPKRHSVYTY